MKIDPPRVRVVVDLVELREKILIFKGGYDDRIMELYKSLLILQINERENMEIIRMFYDIYENKPIIVVIDKDLKEYHYDFREEGYRELEEQFGDNMEGFERYVVNENFAIEFIEDLLNKKKN